MEVSMAAVPQDVVAELQQENARLLAELHAVNDRQNATAEIVRTIVGSPNDIDPQKQVEMLARQLKEAKEQQTATVSIGLQI